ncbi:MAG: HepT-like ribonuclease domain-containing protein [Thermoanaerobaculia bacterium]
MRDVRERLRDILEAIERIERYASRGREAFFHDELVQTWVIRHLQIIGEAARAIPEDVRAVAADIPWPKITGMRHILVHDYFGIDLELVWAVVQDELAPLQDGVRRLLITLGNRE